MNAHLDRALHRFILTAAALCALVVLGQPIETPESTRSLPALLSQLERLPLAGDLLSPLTPGSEDAACDAAKVAASAATDAEAKVAAEALLRSAVRMRWLLTSPHASARGCVAPGCTG